MFTNNEINKRRTNPPRCLLAKPNLKVSHSSTQALGKATLGTVTTGLIGENYNEREDGSQRVRIYIFINFHTYFNFFEV